MARLIIPGRFDVVKWPRGKTAGPDHTKFIAAC
jgi:hypothetical protein